MDLTGNGAAVPPHHLRGAQPRFVGIGPGHTDPEQQQCSQQAQSMHHSSLNAVALLVTAGVAVKARCNRVQRQRWDRRLC